MKKLLQERGSTHGDFTDNAWIAQQLKTIIYSGRHYDKRTPVEKEAIDMICHKLARWVSAENYHNDNAVDIAGYATLVTERAGDNPLEQ